MDWKIFAICCCLIFFSLVTDALSKPRKDGYPATEKQPFFDHHLDKKVEELKRHYQLHKASGNKTELHRVRRQLQQSLPVAQMQNCNAGGRALIKTVTVVTNSFVAMFQSAIDALEEKIKEVNNMIADLNREEREKVPKALMKLLRVQVDFVIAKRKLINLASTTISRVNQLLIGIDGITPGARRIDKRVRTFLRDFENLLNRSTTILKEALRDYKMMNYRISEVRSTILSFKSMIKTRLERKVENKDAWISKTRKAVYGGCVASILLGPLILVCYAIGAPILEHKISQYNAEIANLENLSNMTIANLTDLHQRSTDQYDHINEELKAVVDWQEKVIENQQFFEELFDNKEIDDDDILDFLEITRGGRGGMNTGKTQTFDMLCGLANVCKRYLQRDHFIKDLEDLDIPEVDDLCTKLSCKVAKYKGESPKTITELRIIDFEVIGSLGGGLSAGTTYKSHSNKVDKVNNKYTSHITGSSPGVTKHASLFNIMSHFSSKLRAGSTVSSEAVGTIKEGNGLNFATFGATIDDADLQADKLIEAIKEKEMPVSWDSSWKLITVDFGLDSLFLDYEVLSSKHFMLYRSLLQKLKMALPNTVVLLLSPMNPLELHPTNPLVNATLLMTASNTCKNELKYNAEQFSKFLENISGELRTDTFGIEVIPSMQRFGKLIGENLPDDMIQSKIGKFIWNNFIAKEKSSTKSCDKIKCTNSGNKLHLTPPVKKQTTRQEGISSNEMGIEIEVKQGTDAEVRIKFVNEKTDEFTTKNLNEKGCFSNPDGCKISKDILSKKDVIRMNFVDVFDVKDTSLMESKDLSLLLTSKELSFKIESSDDSVSIRKIVIKGCVIQSYTGDVQNKDGFKKLEVEQFYACSNV